MGSTTYKDEETGETWQGERDVDQVAGPDSAAGMLRQGREQSDPCNNPELRSMGLCNKDDGMGRAVEPARGPREDIYGPRDQHHDE